MGKPNYIREPISLYSTNQTKEKSSDLLHSLKKACSENLNIGIAIKTGDCFFDSMAQRLNELNIKPDYHFTAKSLREDCSGYAKQHDKQDSWIYKAVIKDADVGYFVALEGPYGPIQDPKTKINVIDKEKTFNKYLEDIKNMTIENGPISIWGRPEIEGRMICDKYEVELYFYSINEEYGQKITVTKITAHDDEPRIFIEDIDLNQLKIDNSKKAIHIVNYMRHFVPLLSEISEDIKESRQVSSEEILGTDREVPPSDQPEQKIRKEKTDSSTDKINSQVSQNHETVVKGIHTETSENTEASQQVSSEEILGTDREVPPSDQPEQEPRKERINTNTSRINPPVLQDHTNKGIPISHQPEQNTRQEGIQKRLINSYKKEAIYGTVAVIAAVVFTPSAIAAVLTQSIPFACLAGIALVVACVCVYQLTQSHKNINELKSELEENSTHTFLGEVGLRMHSLINKATSRI